MKSGWRSIAWPHNFANRRRRWGVNIDKQNWYFIFKKCFNQVIVYLRCSNIDLHKIIQLRSSWTTKLLLNRSSRNHPCKKKFVFVLIHCSNYNEEQKKHLLRHSQENVLIITNFHCLFLVRLQHPCDPWPWEYSWGQWQLCLLCAAPPTGQGYVL